MKPIVDALDMGRADRIIKYPNKQLWTKKGRFIYTPHRITALGAYVEATQAPLVYPREPVCHAQYPWIQAVPHGISPEGVVYADTYETIEKHQERVKEIPRDRWWRCQGFLLASGAPVCDYITIWPVSAEEAHKQAPKWMRSKRYFKAQVTYYHIHRIKPDAEAQERLLKAALKIREAVHGKDEEGREERVCPDQVRTEFVPSRRTASGNRTAHGGDSHIRPGQ